MSDSEKPVNILLAGVKILDAPLVPHGFKFVIETTGKGSGGLFACGSYRKDDRRLELHFRYSLGLVTYHIGPDSLDHENYMRLLGVYGRNRYPDFPQDPLESFQHLGADIQNYCADFVFGGGNEFRSLAAKLRENPAMFKGLVS